MPRLRPLWPLALAALFAVLVALRVHGFSLAAWHEVIDGSAPSEVLLGAPRAIRSDEWKAQLPLALAQRVHEPPFPERNRLVGLGQSAWLPLELPVAHPLVLLRPTLWGFFLGDDVGLAWMWWTRVLGLVAVWLAVLRRVARGRTGLAAAGALLLAGSPFHVFWSYNGAPVATALGAGLLALCGLARARRPAAIAASGLGLAFAGGWFALAVYPPYQVTLAWLGAALAVGAALDARAAGAPAPERAGLRAAVLACAAAAVAAALAVFAWEARDAIAAMAGTAYPGRRVATGGDRTLWQLANAPLAAGWWARDWGPLHNICEAAAFWWLSPPLAAFWLWRWARGAPVDRFAAAVLAYQLALLAYVTVGFPAWLARATGLSLVPGRRAVIGLGLADVILVVRFLASAAPAARGLERVGAVAIGAAWALALAAAAGPLARALAGASLPGLFAIAAANGVLAGAALGARARARPLAALAAASLATTIWFNPLAVGGADWLRANPLAREITAIDRAAGGDTVWASFGRDDVANLFRALGVRSLNGVVPLPQPDLWTRVDPRRRYERVWNRYAHFALVAAPVPHPRFQLHAQDYVILRLDPRGPALRALGATHVLFRGSPRERRAFDRLAGFEHLASVGENHLYRVPPVPGAAAAP